VTYRDDHDAAIARAEALQRELERAEADRDRLRAEVERLEHSSEPVPESALVVAAPIEMTVAEVNELVDELDVGLRASRSRGRRQTVVALLLIGGGLATFLASPFGALTLTMGGVLCLVAAAVRNGGDQTAILTAVRDAPERIRALRDTDTGRLQLSTGYHAAFCQTRAPSVLLAKLARRCPAATVKRELRIQSTDDS
jgi:hypothetical protein